MCMVHRMVHCMVHRMAYRMVHCMVHRMAYRMVRRMHGVRMVALAGTSTLSSVSILPKMRPSVPLYAS